ncbi:MAG: hypothetical protein HC945_02015 [Nitrosarchaeum sp.]|nr:hypothetical protein [Nitrosarchaeum sp.]
MHKVLLIVLGGVALVYVSGLIFIFNWVMLPDGAGDAPPIPQPVFGSVPNNEIEQYCANAFEHCLGGPSDSPLTMLRAVYWYDHCSAERSFCRGRFDSCLNTLPYSEYFLCLNDFAWLFWASENFDLCLLNNFRNECFALAGVIKKDPALCDQVEHELMRSECRNGVFYHAFRKEYGGGGLVELRLSASELLAMAKQVERKRGWVHEFVKRNWEVEIESYSTRAYCSLRVKRCYESYSNRKGNIARLDSYSTCGSINCTENPYASSP